MAKSKAPLKESLYREEKAGSVFATRELISGTKLGGRMEMKLKRIAVHHVLLLDTSSSGYDYTIEHAQLRMADFGYVSTDDLAEHMGEAAYAKLCKKLREKNDAIAERIFKINP